MITRRWQRLRPVGARIHGSSLDNELSLVRPSLEPGARSDECARICRRNGRFDKANLHAEIAHQERCGRRFIPADQARGHLHAVLLEQDRVFQVVRKVS